MFGLATLLVIGLYLLISLGVVKWAINYARRNGKNAKRWGWGAAFVMYNLVFWDWIPTVAMHQYYCSTEAGFWVYKTPEEWGRENPGVLEELLAPSSRGSSTTYESFDNGHGKKIIFHLNNHFNWVINEHDLSSFLPIIQTEQVVIDVKNQEILTRYIDFGAGNSVKNTVGPPGPLKFWMSKGSCMGGEINKDKLRNFRDHFYGSKK